MSQRAVDAMPEPPDQSDAYRDFGHTADRNETEQPAARFRLVPAGQMEPKPPQMLIKGLLEWDALADVFGDPACGKSFFAIGVACCIATGTPCHGKAIAKRGLVVYLAGEGHNGLARRFKAWTIRHGVSLADAPLLVSTTPASLTDPDGLNLAIAQINTAAEKYGPPVLIVIDTLARNFGPGDENSTKDMSAFVAACDRLRAQYRATVLLLHHTGHSDKSRGRGAMALLGALDAEYRMDKDDSGVIRLDAVKLKDAEKPEPMAFRLRTVELGIEDEDGNQVTSAVLDETDYQPPSKPGKTGRGKWQTVGLEALEVLYSEHRGRLESKGYDPDGSRVLSDDWRTACLNKGMSRQSFATVKKSLVEQGSIYQEHGYVYLGG
jgi:hypothetical protein